MNADIRKYFAEIGRKGGRKSKRRLSPLDAKNMVRVREAKRAFVRFHTSCFWSYDPQWKISFRDVHWVAEQLMRNGGREAWVVGKRLCR